MYIYIYIVSTLICIYLLIYFYYNNYTYIFHFIVNMTRVCMYSSCTSFIVIIIIMFISSINNILHRAFASAKIPSRLEPSGPYCSDGKRPDGMTLIPWKRGRILVWDATCWDTFAPSNLPQAIREAGAVAAKAEQIKEAKYGHLNPNHLFIPIAFETSGSLGPTTAGFIKELAHLISRENDEPLAHQYLLQRLSVAIQRGNAISIWGTFGQQEGLPLLQDLQ